MVELVYTPDSGILKRKSAPPFRAGLQGTLDRADSQLGVPRVSNAFSAAKDDLYGVLCGALATDLVDASHSDGTSGFQGNLKGLIARSPSAPPR